MWRIVGMTSCMAPHLGSYFVCTDLAMTYMIYVLVYRTLNWGSYSLQLDARSWEFPGLGLMWLYPILSLFWLKQIWRGKYLYFACCILQVYEDDVERNYQLLVELLIALKDVLRQDGLPFVKDLQAMWVIDVSSVETQNFSDIALGAWCSFLDILIVLWPEIQWSGELFIHPFPTNACIRVAICWPHCFTIGTSPFTPRGVARHKSRSHGFVLYWV